MIKNILILSPIFVFLTFTGCTINKVNNNINEYSYNYTNSNLADREKEILEIAKQAAIIKFGEKAWNEDKPYKAKLANDIWWISGTLYYEINGKLYKNGDIGEDGKPIFLIGGTIEAKISDKTLRVLEVFHSQ